MAHAGGNSGRSTKSGGIRSIKQLRPPSKKDEERKRQAEPRELWKIRYLVADRIERRRGQEGSEAGTKRVEDERGEERVGVS